MTAERKEIGELSDGDRMSAYREEDLTDAEVIERECLRYGIEYDGKPLGAWALLRHIYNNRDAALGALRYSIELLKEKSEARDEA